MFHKNVLKPGFISAALAFSIFFFTGCKDKTDNEGNNYFSIDRTVYSIDYCSVSIEQGTGGMKYDIDLSCCNVGNPFIPNDLIETRNFVCFTLVTGNRIDTGGTMFVCSKKEGMKKGYGIFSGTLTTDGHDLKISTGRVNMQITKERVILNFQLTLDNRTHVKGNYSGPYTEIPVAGTRLRGYDLSG